MWGGKASETGQLELSNWYRTKSEGIVGKEAREGKCEKYESVRNTKNRDRSSGRSKIRWEKLFPGLEEEIRGLMQCENPSIIIFPCYRRGHSTSSSVARVSFNVVFLTDRS